MKLRPSQLKSPSPIVGLAPDGEPRHVLTDTDGNLIIGSAVESLVTEDANFEILLRQLIGILGEPLWWNKLVNAIQVSQATPGSLQMTMTFASSQTLPTVTNLAQFGTVPADMVVANIASDAWANCIRARFL